MVMADYINTYSVKYVGFFVGFLFVNFILCLCIININTHILITIMYYCIIILKYICSYNIRKMEIFSCQGSVELTLMLSIRPSVRQQSVYYVWLICHVFLILPAQVLDFN